jgi:hypothetical protein
MQTKKGNLMSKDDLQRLRHVPLLLFVVSIFLSLVIMEVDRISIAANIPISNSFRGMAFGILLLSPISYFVNCKLGVYEDEPL